MRLAVARSHSVAVTAAATIIAAPNTIRPWVAPSATKATVWIAAKPVTRAMVPTAPADSSAVSHKVAGTLNAMATASRRTRSTAWRSDASLVEKPSSRRPTTVTAIPPAPPTVTMRVAATPASVSRHPAAGDIERHDVEAVNRAEQRQLYASRQKIFFAPEHPLWRFLHGAVLWEQGWLQKARREMEAAGRLVEGLPPEESVAGLCTAAELARMVAFWLTQHQDASPGNGASASPGLEKT